MNARLFAALAFVVTAAVLAWAVLGGTLASAAQLRPVLLLPLL